MLENLTLFKVVFTSLFSTGTMKRIYQQYASFQISKQSILSKLYCYMSFISKDQLEELQYNVDRAEQLTRTLQKVRLLRTRPMTKYLSLWTEL